MHRSGEIKRGHFLTRREKSIWSLFLKFLLRRKMCALATSNILDNGLESRSKETASILIQVLEHLTYVNGQKTHVGDKPGSLQQTVAKFKAICSHTFCMRENCQ